MRMDLLKPFGDSRYLSEEESLKLIEKIPIPKDDSESVKHTEVHNPISNNNPVVDLESRLVNINSADKDYNKYQNEWIDYFNYRNEIMVSMPDLYCAGKSDDIALFDSLRKDFDIGIITSTIIIYDNKPKARIIHNYGSKLVKPVEYRLIIPEYTLGNKIEDVLGTKTGLRFLQKLFETKDNAEQIKDTLHKLSNYPLGKIEVCSKALFDRPTAIASGFSYCDGKFFVNHNSMRIGHSRSRAMHIDTKGTPQTNGGVK